MVVLGIVLARVEAAQIEHRALANATDSAVILAQIGLQSHFDPSDISDGLDAAKVAELDDLFQAGVANTHITRVKIWSMEGRVVYSQDRTLIGRTFPVSSDLGEALAGETTSDVSSLTAAENVAEKGFGQLLEVYVPLRFTPTGPPAGAFELYLPYEPVAAATASDDRRLYVIILAGLVLVWATLFRIVLGASRRLRRDASELRHQAATNEYLALHDQLTDLPNRTLFHDRVEQAIVATAREGSIAAVMILDLDRFKEINDTLGHEHGDVLLAELGPRFRGVLREVDTVARLGGDEFGILLEGLHGEDEAVGVGEKLTAALVDPFLLGDTEIEVGASIGIALSPDHGGDADALMRRAEVAMYVAKAARDPLSVYSVEHDHYTKDRLTLITDLRRAIDAGEITLAYQPKLDLARLAVVGLEALARWDHPERGPVPPDVFVPLAEHTGLIRRLTPYVLNLALEQCREWGNAGLDLPVAVNLSARDLLDPGLPNLVAEVLRRHDLDPGSLVLELTEGSVMDRPAMAEEILDHLASMGVALAIDDFGTGYSSLAYLQRLPMRELKIDRSFVMGMRTNEGDAAIVHSTIDLGHNLGLIVVAEGVEDAESLERLAEMGCDIAQGYHVARPMPPDQIEGWLRSSGSSVGDRMLNA
jgi:diguanylate cyclase (GGDEF)-like protein